MPDPNKLALVIGIDVYDDKNLDQLPACKKDAQGVLNLLSSIDYAIFGERPIIGSNLDKENGWIKIRENIGNFFTRAKPSQTLLFYFSGHGILKGNELYLATPQIDTKDPATRGYSISELTNYVRDSNSRRIVCMIDSCYSGTVDLKMKSKAAKDEADNAKRLFDRSWKRIPKSKGRYLLLSSQSYEKSWAEDDNSIFTKYVIAGLKGVKPITDENGRYIEGSGSVDINGDVTPDSLHDYVYDKVNSMTNQTPELKIARASKIVLAEYPELSIIPESKETYLELLLKGKITDFNKRRRKDGYSPIDLHGVKLEGKDLKGVIMTRADLSLANLNHSNLQGADLKGANLEGATLREINLQGADLKEANLKGAVLDLGNLRGCNLESADLSYAHCTLTIFDHVIFNNGTWLENANLYRAMFRRARILDAVFDRANLKYADFERAKLCASFDHADLQSANLHGANLRGANFYTANLVNARGISKDKARSMGAIVEWVNPYGNNS